MTNKVKLKYDHLMKLEYDGEVKDGLPHGQGTFNIYGELLFKELIEKLRKKESKESKEDEYDHLFHHTCTTQYLQALIEVSLKDSKPKDFDQDCLEVSIRGNFKEGLWDGRFLRINYDFLNGNESEDEETKDFEIYSEGMIFENNFMVEGRIEFDEGYYFGEVIYNEFFNFKKAVKEATNNKDFKKPPGDLYYPHNEGEYHYYDPDNEKWIRGTWVNGELTKIDYVHECKFFPNNDFYDGGTKIDNIKISKDWRIKIDSSGIPDGYGTMIKGRKHDKDEGSQMYNGMWKDGIMHGKGTLIEKGEYTKIGDLRNYDTHPFEGKKYVGEMKNGKANGEGVLSYIRIKKDVIPQTFWQSINDKDFPPEETKFYEGSFKNDLFHGEGTMFFHDGTSKKGEWTDGKLLIKK